MAANKLIFKNAEKARDAITASQKKEIEKLYKNWADEIGEKAKYYQRKTTASSVVSERQMKELQKQLRQTSQQISNEIYNKTKQNIYLIADEVVKCNKEWLASLGFVSTNLDMAFNYVPDSIVRKLVTGQIYDSGWSLSSRIWGNNEDTLKDIYQIMAGGMAKNQSIYEIAKSLEQYVRPGAAKQWNLTAPDGKRIFPKNVDYNAQRLARTLVQHGYQQSFIETTENNPFVKNYIWVANGSRVCPICQDRDGQVFKKNELPMDHPNGMCTMVPDIDDNLVDNIADWVNSPDGTFPEIDEFAKNFGYSVSNSSNLGIDKLKAMYGNSKYKAVNTWFQKLPKNVQNEAKKIKNASGKTWDEWYGENIYYGDPSDIGKKKTVFNKNAWVESLKNNLMSEMDNWTDDFVKIISSAEKDGINRYTGSAYRNINEFLRGILPKTRYEDDIKAATSGLKKAKLPRETIARRGSGYNMLDSLNLGPVTEENKKKFIGKRVIDKGFTSTSPNPHGGFSGEIEYIIKVPKGSNAMYIESISRLKGAGEYELLIQRGAQFKIEDIEFNSYGEVKKIYMTLEKTLVK